MKIATWNINGMRARLDFLVAWLEARKPDLVGLQELKLTDEQFPHAELEALGYHCESHGQKAWNGVAILSREPIEVTQRGLPNQDEFGARLITARTDKLSFTTVYCPNGKSIDHDDYAKKLEWFDALRTYLDEELSPEEATILCGDFNICPADLDTWDPDKSKGTIFHTDEERKRMQSLYGWGLTDLYRHLHPEEKTYTWWDYRGGAFHRGHGLRIDFLLGNVATTRSLKSVETDREWRKKHDGLTASDHAPVVAELSV